MTIFHASCAIANAVASPISTRPESSTRLMNDLAPVRRIPYRRKLSSLALLSCEPVFLERHGTDVVQRRVESPGIVKAQPVNHLVHCSTTGSELSPVQAGDLQRKI